MLYNVKYICIVNPISCIYLWNKELLLLLTWYRHYNKKWWRYASFMDPIIEQPNN